MQRRFVTLSAVVLLALAPLATSCSSDTVDKAKDTAESAKDDAAVVADKAAARSTAEALRTSLKGNDTADKDGVRSVKAINEAVADLPGDPTVTGIEDGDGDGLDDDGKVQVETDEQQACVTLPETGEDTQVTSGAC